VTKQYLFSEMFSRNHLRLSALCNRTNIMHMTTSESVRINILRIQVKIRTKRSLDKKKTLSIQLYVWVGI